MIGTAMFFTDVLHELLEVLSPLPRGEAASLLRISVSRHQHHGCHD